MALRSMTVHRYEEIRRRLAEGRGLREIARALGCSRRTVREVRDGERLSPDAPKALSDPLWMSAARLADDHPRSGPGASAEVPLGGEGAEPHHVLELLEAVLPQVPAVPGSDRHGARVRARRTRRGRLRRRTDRVDRDQERRDPQSVGLCRGPGLQPAALCLGGRGHEEPQLAWLSSTHVQLLRRRAARDGAGLLEAGRAQVPPVRSGSEPRLRTAGHGLLHGGGPRTREKTEG